MRKLVKKFFVTFALLLIMKTTEAQVSTYVFTASAGIYTDVTGGTEIFDLQDDDELTSAIPIGFNFIYNGVSYSQVQASSNGWLSFVTTQTDPFYINSLTNSNTIRPALYPLWDDLDGFWEGLNFYISAGSSPNRVFTFEWRTFDWQVGAPDDVISFQVKLYETTNIIQFVYRQGTSGPYFPSGTIGIAGQTSGDYLVLNNSSASPTPSSSTFTTSIASSPATGQVYQFAPAVCSGTPTGGSTASTANPVCANTSFTLSVTGASTGSGITYQWQSSPDGSTWTDIGSATAATYAISIATSTWFRRAITCSGNTSYSSGLQVVVSTPVTTVTPGNVCVNSSSILTATAAAGTTTLLSENFNGAAAGWTTVNNSSGGTPANAAWTLRPNGYTYTGTLSFTFNSNDNSQFYLTNSDAAGSGVTTVSTILQSPSFSTVGFTSCNLQFYHHFKSFSSDMGSVEASTNGTSWTTLQTYTATTGIEQAFVLVNISLPAGFIGQPVVYIRFKYDCTWDWFWAVDNVTVSGTPTTVTYAWAASPATGAGLPGSATVASAANSSITVTPTSPGIFTYTVTSSNTCLSPASVNVTATVGSLVSAYVCQALTVVAGDNYVLTGSCNLLAKIVPQGVNPVSGSVQTCVTIDPTVQFYNGQPYVQRHFDIEPAVSPSNSTARITLYATQAEFDAVNAADLLAGDNWPDLPTSPADAIGIARVRITQWHGTGTAPGNYTDPNAILVSPVSVSWNNPDTRWEIVMDVNGFSGFYIHTGYGFALSTPLLTLSGRREGSINVLKWTTQTEQSIRGYSIERSYDGLSFTAIGFVNSLASGGNSNTMLHYDFADNNFTGSKQYYRIKQTAADGRIKTSTVILIKGGVISYLTIGSVFPNPASSILNVMMESPKRTSATLRVTDINGRVLSSRVVQLEQGVNALTINIEKLASGTYFIQLTGAEGLPAISSKFIRQ